MPLIEWTDIGPSHRALAHWYLPEKGSDWSTCFSVCSQVLCVRRVGLVTRYGRLGGELRHWQEHTLDTGICHLVYNFFST